MDTKGELTNVRRTPQDVKADSVQDSFDRDLHPNADKATGVQHERDHTRTAYDEKAIHRRFPELRDDELRAIGFVEDGERLTEGTEYVDLSEDQPKAFTAGRDQSARKGQLLVAKNRVSYDIWNRLTGQVKPGQQTGAEARGVDAR
ncbi:MAG TPA: hypothetical protein VD948_00120 [Rhodothermales bacterium]|nr:hypothetical protein [Rhodothermales bacterium]